ncbi:redoxin domain-containing protein [Bacteroides sp.]|uniref:redoxin domain-containing protein n=1 Tax=Bacteroides sp. TaxID=29523 RepID=UPI003AB12DF0
MQKFLFLFLLLVCNAYSSWSQDAATSERFLITGQVPALPDGIVIGLYKSDGRLIVPIALDTVADGRFTFSDTISYTKSLMLLSSEAGFPSHWLDVWVAPGKQITITGEDRLLPLWRVESDIAEQQEQNGFQDSTRELNREYMGYNVSECGWFRQMQLDHAGDEEFSRLAWAKVDSLRKYSLPLMRAVYKKELDYMVTAPVGKVYMQKLVSYAQMTVAKMFMPYSDEVKALYAQLPEAMKHTPEAELAYQHLYPTAAVEVGDEMADGELYDVQGGSHHLAEFKGRYILLDFWSSGCGPCIESLPEMEEVAEKYKDTLAIVSISIDPQKEWKAFVEKKQMKGNQWNELRKVGTGLAMSYRVKGYPHYVLVAPDGKIQSVWGGYGKGSLLDRLEEEIHRDTNLN